jgi:serine/threonine-protein phosphatase 2A regulatory subunit B
MEDWSFTQCFGEKEEDEEFSEADILSTVEFDSDGDFLATGDKGGRIVVFERTDSGKVSCFKPSCCNQVLLAPNLL